MHFVFASLWYCLCNKGYRLDNNNRTCQDINECKEGDINPCHHQCTNLVGSYKCSCRDGYKLNYDKTSCSGMGMVVLVTVIEYHRQLLCPFGFTATSWPPCWMRITKYSSLASLIPAFIQHGGDIALCSIAQGNVG